MELSQYEIELMERCGEVTCEEAAQIASRYNASHFTRSNAEHARYSIPADPRRDDDLRLAAFIAQHKQLTIEAARLRAGDRVPALAPADLFAVDTGIRAHHPRQEKDTLEQRLAKAERALNALWLWTERVVDNTGSSLGVDSMVYEALRSAMKEIAL